MINPAIILLALIILYYTTDKINALPLRTTQPSLKVTLKTTAPWHSTVTAPPKVDKPLKTPTTTKPKVIPSPSTIFRENRGIHSVLQYYSSFNYHKNIDIAKEFEDYINSETYAVILFNDPYNKRTYVAQVDFSIFILSIQYLLSLYEFRF